MCCVPRITPREELTTKKKITFPEPGCYCCDCYSTQGSPPFETRLCMGGKWKKRGRRFRVSDPQYKSPKWCPKRLPVSVCRIYGFADEISREMESAFMLLHRQEHRAYNPSAFHYKLRAEIPVGMSAKAFYEVTMEQTLEDLLPGQNVEYGEVLEIDDGLKPYFFMRTNSMTVLPIPFFAVDMVKKSEVCNESQYDPPPDLF